MPSTATKRNTSLQPKKAAFLAAYAETATVTHAARAAQVDRVQHYRWLASDDGYRAAFEIAAEEAVEKLEREAMRRAAEGVDEPVFHKGEVVGYVRKYSDTLLIFLLKAARPDKYRDNLHLDLTGDIRLQAFQAVATLSPEQLRELAAGAL